MKIMETATSTSDITAAVLAQIGDVVPALATAGAVVISVAIANVMWFKFGPSIVRRIFSRA
jgi:hypothetical protein